MKTTVIAFVLLVTGAVLLWMGAGSLAQGRRASTWGATPGAVVSARCVEYSDLENGRRFFTEVSYRYRVADREYHGDRVAYGYAGGWWQTPNQRIADRLSALDSVRVRFDPQHPSTAVLATGINGAIVLTLFAGAWLVLLGALVMRYARRPTDGPSSLRLEWGSGAPRVVALGAGRIWLLALAGWGMAAVLSALIHVGIVRELVAR